MIDKTSYLPEVEKVFQQIDQLIAHLKNQGNLSQKDVEFLREVIFHIDGLLNKLNLQEETQEIDIVKNDLIHYLTDANDHLRKVLLDHEGTDHQHHPEHQEENNRFFVDMIHQLKNLA